MNKIEAKTFKRQAAQGDLVITRIEELPLEAVLVAQEGAETVLTHSETGHPHVVQTSKVELYGDATNPFIGWLKVNEPVTLLHKKSVDTHGPISIDKGIYRLNRQREWTPEGFRKAAD
jgi:hypothetical protein